MTYIMCIELKKPCGAMPRGFFCKVGVMGVMGVMGGASRGFLFCYRPSSADNPTAVPLKGWPATGAGHRTQRRAPAALCTRQYTTRSSSRRFLAKAVCSRFSFMGTVDDSWRT